MAKKSAIACPHCGGALSIEMIGQLWGSYCGNRRQSREPGPGRPRTMPRCPCGAMTVNRAEQRKHVCTAPKPARAPKAVA